MAGDTRSITITLKLDKGEQEPNVNNQTQTQGGSASSEDKDSGSKGVAMYMGIQAAQIVTSELLAWGDYYWNRELMLTDDYIAQRNKSIATTHINRTISYVSTIGTMAATGAQMGGWVGAIIGAAVGTISVGSSIFRSNEQGTQQQNLQLSVMQAQLDFTRSRAGWSTKAASIGEDL